MIWHGIWRAPERGYIGYTVCILAELAYEGEIPKGSVHIWSLKS